MSGTAFSAVAGVPFESLEVVKGEDLIRYFDKSPADSLAFCSTCGSSLFGKLTDREMCHLRAGILDDEPTQRPTASFYFGSRSRWHDPDDSIARHDTLASRSA